MKDPSSVLVNINGGPFPGYSGKNATGAGATDGTEWIKAYIDDYGLGPVQAILDHENITPNGVTESAGASQVVDAIQKMFPPGMVAEWNLNADPATTGHRFLLLNGQGILRANYPDLDANVYVGDVNNASADAYYRADDAAGTTRNIVGAYLILPESRGYTVRGLDLAASIDPDGASRTIGHLQDDAFQAWQLGSDADLTGAKDYWGIAATRDARTAATGGVPNETYPQYTTIAQGSPNGLKAMDDGTNGTPRTDSETRMINRSTTFAIRY